MSIHLFSPTLETDPKCPRCEEHYGHRKLGDEILCESCYERKTMIKGGHAIMLRVELPEYLLTSLGRGYMGEVIAPHVTLAFVGRNLPEAIGGVLLEAAEFAIRSGAVPDYIGLSGKYDLFGGKKDHLVALVEQDFNLIRLRDMILHRLFDNDVRLATTFAFNPHVSLMKLDAPESVPGDGIPSMVRVLGIDVKIGDRIESL